MNAKWALWLGFLVVIAHATTAKADELKVYVPRAISTVLDGVAVQFERQSGYKLVITSDVGAGLLRRINAGEPFDIFAGTPDR